ncbi:hypothetical protein SLS58_004372 [Diplodia intermedia]|uniref:HRDC domain-containing protein n=1 Tax=Diplodia intermedia TaxID=856260 RepID=A0ABR3TTV1_9PEZI
MTSTVRYGLKLALRPSFLPRSPLYLPRRPPSASAVRRAYHPHPALHTSASAPSPEHNYHKDTAAEEMDIASESQDTVSTQTSIDAEPEPIPSHRPPAALKPGDSFGSDFYGDLNDFSLESPEYDGKNKPAEAGALQNEARDEQTALDEEEMEPPFELTFKRKPLPAPVAPTEIPKEIPPSLWSHLLYQGPDGNEVDVHYCRTFEESESVAQHFLNEPVVGLDMEWSPYAPEDSIKHNASVLQLACQDRIAIFHLSQHQGVTPDEIMPPSLKAIIESDKILKAGVSVNRADGSRLRKYFKLKPQGMFELSHLYHLIAKKRTAGGYISRTLKGLNQQVEEKLGIPLDKGSVRTSDWSRPLNQSQINYAATDAYAGFMLFHVMNEERKLMKPTPPLPEFAERDLPIMGAPAEKEADAEDPSDDLKTETGPTVSSSRAQDQLHGPSLLLYEALCSKRKEVAAAKGIPRVYHLASNQALARVAISQPRTVDALRQIKGMGDATLRHFGAECMYVVERFLQDGPASVKRADDVPDDVIIDDPITSVARRKKQSSRNAPDLDYSGQFLYEALCTKRKEIAAERRIASWQFYRIAHNGVLKKIAHQRPTTLDELRGIEGVGDYSARQFGHHWLSIVKNFSSGMPEKPASENELSDDNDSEVAMSEDEILEITADNLPPGAEGCLKGQRIVFTGILDMLGRTGAQDLAEKCGARVLEKPDAATSLIVTGRDVSENKLQYIAEYGFKSVSEEGFLALVLHKAREVQAAATQQRAQRPLAGLATLVAAQGHEDVDPSVRPFHNALRAFRTQLAAISKLPAESICSDADIRAIAVAKPPRRANLLRLPGGKGLDVVSQQCNKSVDDFLVKYNRTLPTFEPSSNEELDALLDRARRHIIVPAHLNPEQKRLVYREKHRARLSPDAPEPVWSAVAGVDVALEHIDRHSDIPSRWHVFSNALRLAETPADWENVGRLIEGLADAGVPMTQMWVQKFVREAAIKGMMHVVLRALQRAERTDVRLGSRETVSRVMWAVRGIAANNGWGEIETDRALRYAQLVVELMESEEHVGGPKRRVPQLGDLRTLPFVIATPLELAAARALRYTEGADKDGMVQLYAERLCANLKNFGLQESVPQKGKSTNKNAAEGYGKVSGRYGRFLEATDKLRRLIPVWHGLVLAQRVLKPKNLMPLADIETYRLLQELREGIEASAKVMQASLQAGQSIEKHSDYQEWQQIKAE